MLTSGDMNSLSPFTGEANVTPSSVILRIAPERPHLKTATVGEDGFVPTFKAVQAAKALHHIQAGAHPQVKGVAQNDLRAHFFEAARHHAFDRAVGAHGHEDGGLHHAVVERERAAAGMAGCVFGENVKLQHGRSFKLVNGFLSSSMASP